MRKTFVAGTDDHDRRLDTVVRKLLPHLTLGGIQKAIRQGDIRKNGSKAWPDQRVQNGDSVEVWDRLVGDPADSTTCEVGPGLEPEWILWEDADLLIVNKPAGLIVHPGSDRGYGADPALDQRVRSYLAPKLPATLSFRPGPLHRLDRETSGILVFSKSLKGARTFSEALVHHEVKKTYLAVVVGNPPDQWSVNVSISRDDLSRRTFADESGQASTTRFQTLARADHLALVQVDLGTGRTHQIRAHASHSGFPLAGDRKYGSPPVSNLPSLWILHAWKLQFQDGRLYVAQPPSAVNIWLKKTFKFSS